MTICLQDNAVSQLQRRADDDKNHALDELAQELEHQHNSLISQAEHSFRQEATDLQGQLAVSVSGQLAVSVSGQLAVSVSGQV